jgi:hypothetical protein
MLSNARRSVSQSAMGTAPSGISGRQASSCVPAPALQVWCSGCSKTWWRRSLSASAKASSHTWRSTHRPWSDRGQSRMVSVAYYHTFSAPSLHILACVCSSSVCRSASVTEFAAGTHREAPHAEDLQPAPAAAEQGTQCGVVRPDSHLLGPVAAAVRSLWHQPAGVPESFIAPASSAQCIALGCPAWLAHLRIVSYDACSLIGCVKRVMIVTPFKCRVPTTQPTRHPSRRSQRCVAGKPLHAVRHVRHPCTSPNSGPCTLWQPF